MNISLELNKFVNIYFHPLEDNLNTKGWKYSFVYSLSDIRDICCVLETHSKCTKFKDIVDYCKKENIISEKGKAWNIRSVEEIINALRNFEVLEIKSFKFLKGNPFNTKIGEPLSKEDFVIFTSIFEKYIRFTDFHRLFLDKESVKLSELKETSNLIFSYISEGRFVNNFLIPETKNIITVKPMSSDVMRFWDVYLKWGATLGLIEKYPAKPFGIKCVPTSKSLSLVYFINDMPSDFSIFDYLDRELDVSYIYIPDMYLHIIKKYRYPLNKIIEKLVFECKNDERFRAITASTIFIKDTEKFLIPKINNSYITHLIRL